jgi:hypothetical protein
LSLSRFMSYLPLLSFGPSAARHHSVRSLRIRRRRKIERHALAFKDIDELGVGKAVVICIHVDADAALHKHADILAEINVALSHRGEVALFFGSLDRVEKPCYDRLSVIDNFLGHHAGSAHHLRFTFGEDFGDPALDASGRFVTLPLHDASLAQR